MKVRLKGEPIVKTNKFCPNPVTKYGIPTYADSMANPKVINTQGWIDWWREQIRRCVHGYYTGGLWLPGRYYYFLNYCILHGPDGAYYPNFVDFQYELALFVEHLKRSGKGMIGLKARRKGLSEFMAKGVVDHGLRFRESYLAGVAAGLDTYSEKFYSLLVGQDADLPPEMRLKKLKVTDDTMQIGYKENVNGEYIKSGSKNTFLKRTMYLNPNQFKGQYMSDVIFEEGGEFPLLDQGLNATEDCLKIGDIQYGTHYIYGTGGNVKKESRVFQEIWSDPEAYNVEKFWVSGKKMFAPCYVGSSRDRKGFEEDTPYINQRFPGLTRTQKMGMSDEKRADERIEERIKEFQKKKQKKKLKDFRQNNPRNAQEAFLTSSENNYDDEVLNEIFYSLTTKKPNYGEYILDYKKDAEGSVIVPHQISCRPAKPSDNEDNIVLISDNGMPRSDVMNLDLMGVDSYDIDQSATSKSLGGAMIYRCQNQYGIEGEFPVAIYYKRPRRKEVFYDIVYKMGVFWGTKRKLLIDAGSPRIIDHIRNKPRGEKLLAGRPTSMESPNSEQKHNYGMKFTTYNLPLCESFVQSWIIDHAHKCPFPQVAMDCMGYQTGDLDSDCDLHDALMLCLSLKYHLKLKPRKIDEEEEQGKYIPGKGASSNDPNRMFTKDEVENGKVVGDLFSEMVSRGYYNNQQE